MATIGLTRGRLIASIEKTQVENCDTSYDDEEKGKQWSIEDFDESFTIKLVERAKDRMEFDLVGIDAPIVNAFRRILMSEIPTMAIEKVFIVNNTSIFQDDFLAHRLGLIPIKVDPRLFEYRQEGDTEGTPQDTIEMVLKVKCTKNPECPKESSLPTDLYLNRNVYSGNIEWVPLGNQESLVKEPVKPVNEDILIAKLSPGQELDLRLHCVKGIGRDHAKFSPVATVYYRLLPVIEITRPVIGEDAKLLQSCFSKGVIEVQEDENGNELATVGNARNDSLSRNFYRFKQLEDAVKMGLKKDYFIFNIETTGILSPDLLFLESVEILSSKCRHFLREVQELKDA